MLTRMRMAGTTGTVGTILQRTGILPHMGILHPTATLPHTAIPRRAIKGRQCTCNSNRHRMRTWRRTIGTIVEAPERIIRTFRSAQRGGYGCRLQRSNRPRSSGRLIRWPTMLTPSSEVKRHCPVCEQRMAPRRRLHRCTRCGIYVEFSVGQVVRRASAISASARRFTQPVAATVTAW